MKSFLDGVPVFFPYEYAVGARAGNEDRLMSGRRFIQEPIELFAGLAGVHGVHRHKRTLFRTFTQVLLSSGLPTADRKELRVYSKSSGSSAIPFSPAAFLSQYLRTQASQLLPAAVSRPVNASAAMSD
jgi:hypothetical protein